MAGPLWQRRNGSDFVFFQSHTGFARGPVGGTYEDMLCNEFAPALHFVNVRAQRYKCQVRRLVLGDQVCAPLHRMIIHMFIIAICCLGFNACNFGGKIVAILHLKSVQALNPQAGARHFRQWPKLRQPKIS